jgi:hypothetical protein
MGRRRLVVLLVSPSSSTRHLRHFSPSAGRWRVEEAGRNVAVEAPACRRCRNYSQNGVMARRNSPRRGGRRLKGSDNRQADLRPVPIGTHWRADGQPKSSYRSQGEALGVADERRSESGVALNVYQCAICRGWHLGSSGGRTR